MIISRFRKNYKQTVVLLIVIFVLGYGLGRFFGSLSEPFALLLFALFLGAFWFARRRVLHQPRTRGYLDGQGHYHEEES